MEVLLLGNPPWTGHEGLGETPPLGAHSRSDKRYQMILVRENLNELQWRIK